MTPKSSGVSPKFQSLTQSLPTRLMAQRGSLLDSPDRMAPLFPSSGQRDGRAWVTSTHPVDSGRAPTQYLHPPTRLPCPVSELCERGDPERSPGRGEGHLGHLGEGCPPHAHRGPLQSHRAGHHADRRPEEVRDFPRPGAAGLGRVSWRGWLRWL